MLLKGVQNGIPTLKGKGQNDQYDPEMPLPRDVKTQVHTKLVYHYSPQHHAKQPTTGNNPNF